MFYEKVEIKRAEMKFIENHSNTFSRFVQLPRELMSIL